MMQGKIPNKKQSERKGGFDQNGFEVWGGYMNAKKSKLENQFLCEAATLEKTEKLSDIFQGVSIFVNGYTNPSAEELRMLMLVHGGVYHHYESENTMYVIASNLPNTKMKLLKTTKFVKPEWITESVKAGRLLDYKNFLLYTNQSKLQPRLNFDGKSTENCEMNNTGKSQNNSIMGSSGSSSNVAKTAVDPKFLSEFYNNSRLHHIATMGAMFKQYVIDLKKNHKGEFKGRDRLLSWKEKSDLVNQIDDLEPELNGKVIMHIDMDCFFASVALRNHPELKGQPVAVTHAKGNPTHQRPGADRKFEYEYYQKLWDNKVQSINPDKNDEGPIDGDDDIVPKKEKDWKEAYSMSEIASCSYEARKAGIKNGMLLGTALKLCPNLKTVSYDFEGYKEVSYCLYDTIAEYTLDIEAVSCDELFVDCTELLSTLKLKPTEFTSFLRQEIKEKTRCPASSGLGSNKLQARLATRRAKPDGQFYLEPSLVSEFMQHVSIDDLPGVGRTFSYRLQSLGAKTCKDLQGFSLEFLKKEFGNKNGDTLYKFCRGEDERNVKSNHQRKSVSAEVNYGIRFTTQEEAHNFLKQLSTEVSNRLKEINMKGKSITFKLLIRAKNAPIETAKFLGHGVCDYITKSVSLPSCFDDSLIIFKQVINIYNNLNIPPNELRGIGIQISKLEVGKKSVGLDNFLKPIDELQTKSFSNCSKETKTANKSNMLKQIFTKQIEKKIKVERPKERVNIPSANELDRDVIAALPDDIRNEVLQQYHMKMDDLKVVNETEPTSSNLPAESDNPTNVNNEITLSQVDNSVLESLPKEIQDEIKNELKSKTENASKGEKSNVCNMLTLQELRHLIGEWVSTEKSPQKCDIDMIAEYIQQLIKDRNLENVDIVVRCLQRHISKIVLSVPIWRSVYETIITQIQENMITYYGSKLKIDELHV